MHVLAAHNRDEFLSCPQLIRFDYPHGLNDREPTLLIKASTLMLKYIVLGVRMQLVFARLGERLLYGLLVFDDPEKAGLAWSILEREEEILALLSLARGEPCQTFLFNEIAVNVAWSAVQLDFGKLGIDHMIEGVQVGRIDQGAFNAEVASLVDHLHRVGSFASDVIVSDVPITKNWNPVSNHFITSHADASPISLFDADEGNQQEQVAIWLTDNLCPAGVHHSPQIPKGKSARELTDIILSHEFGTILIESKSLSIFGREALPNRAKLAHNITAHIAKAAAQLKGGMRRLKDGSRVSSRIGDLLDIERTQPMHGIILIPELDLIEDRDSYGLPFILDFMRSTGGFLHLLDIAELLRVVQAAEMIAARSKSTTRMIAFDYYLMKRAERAMENKTLCFEMLLRFVD